MGAADSARCTRESNHLTSGNVVSDSNHELRQVAVAGEKPKSMIKDDLVATIKKMACQPDDAGVGRSDWRAHPCPQVDASVEALYFAIENPHHTVWARNFIIDRLAKCSLPKALGMSAAVDCFLLLPLQLCPGTGGFVRLSFIFFNFHDATLVVASDNK